MSSDPIPQHDQTVQDLIRQLDAAKAAFFAACADRVRKGLDTPDTLAARSSVTAVTIRKELRARGVGALPRGPKPRTT
ncbi:hypothetical protein [Nonomuraea sp. NPDC050310]|uniref:hypothetical protein n=1 Tax=Nonomuraea sp. NPDC050310 TaxID=3154935 RepID=UPI0033D9FAA9